MCKVLACAGIKDIKNGMKFLRTSREFLTQDDSDGYGYAITDGEKLKIERWLHVEEAFDSHNTISKVLDYLKKKYEDTIFVRKTQDVEGSVDYKKIQSFIAHGRMATCGISLDKTHPFTSEGVAMIHNGVITNQDTYISKYKCDSEAILDRYIHHNVIFNLDMVQNVVDELDGYQAVAVLSPEYLDIWRDSSATLYMAHIEEIGAEVICTTAEIIENTVAKLGWAKVECCRINDDQALRLDNKTGDVIEDYSIDSFYSSPINSGLYGDTDYDEYSYVYNPRTKKYDAEYKAGTKTPSLPTKYLPPKRFNHDEFKTEADKVKKIN